MSQNEEYFWCAFEARQDNSIIIQYIVLFAQFVIFVMLIYARIKAKRQKQLEQLSVVYKLIIAWLICFFLKTLMNVIPYFTYIQESPSNVSDHQNTNGQQNELTNFTGLRIMSSFFLFLDFATTFFLQIAMIYIPYLWMRNALQLMSQENLQVEDRIRINRISWFLGLVKKYMLFRNIYFAYYITVAVLVIASDSFKSVGKYIPITSIVESFVILIIYPTGLWTWKLIKKNILLNEKEQKSMLIQYGILIFCNVLRIIMNSVFYFSDLVHYQPDKYCYDNHSTNQTIINCMYLTLGLLFMHILPGSMILYIYWPSKRDKTDLRTSLLISNSQTKLY